MDRALTDMEGDYRTIVNLLTVRSCQRDHLEQNRFGFGRSIGNPEGHDPKTQSIEQDSRDLLQ